MGLVGPARLLQEQRRTRPATPGPVKGGPAQTSMVPITATITQAVDIKSDPGCGRKTDPDMGLGSSPFPDVTMVPGHLDQYDPAVWPTDSSMSLGDSLHSRHEHGLQWSHEPSMQTLDMAEPWTQSDTTLGHSPGPDNTLTPVDSPVQANRPGTGGNTAAGHQHGHK